MRCLALLLLGACTRGEGDDPPDTSTYPPSALVLVLDGVRVDELTSTTPSSVTGVSGEEYAHKVWVDLVPDAALVRAAINPGVTITAPGHVEMLTGRVDPLANYSTALAGAGLYRPELPTLFEEARDQLDLAPADALFLVNTELLLPATSSLYPGLGEAVGATYEELFDPDMPEAPVNDDTPVMDELKARIKEDHPRLTFVNFHDVDRAGHYGGDGAYAADVSKLDSLLAEFWRWLDDHEPGYKRDLIVIVTADHGRHRHDEDNGWKNHGDACTGCREVPLLVLGPGVHAGEELQGTTTLLDLGPTLAAHLGVDLPWAEGLPMAPAFESLDAPARAGDVSVAASATHVALTHHLDDYEARSEVRVDGERLSTEGALAADGAVLYDDPGGTLACFRELSLPGGELFWPWHGRCLQEVDGAWVDLAFPEDEVGTNWLPAFASTPSGTWVAYNHNPDGIGELGVNDEVGLYLRRVDATGWSSPLVSSALFPVAPTLLPTGDGVIVAFATNEADEESRYTRHIRVQHVRIDDDGEPATVSHVELDLSPWLGEDPRVERAQLARLSGGDVGLAMVGIGAASRDVFVYTSHDDGVSWGEPTPMGATGTLFAHLGPRWDGDAVVWADVGADGVAEFCRQAADGATGCVSAESPRVDSFVVAGGVVTASVDMGVGDWEVRTFTIP